MSKFLARFVKNESGATAIEYGLIAALISIAIIAGVRSIGSKLSNTFRYDPECFTGLISLLKLASFYDHYGPDQSGPFFFDRYRGPLSRAGRLTESENQLLLFRVSGIETHCIMMLATCTIF